MKKSIFAIIVAAIACAACVFLWMRGPIQGGRPAQAGETQTIYGAVAADGEIVAADVDIAYAVYVASQIPGYDEMSDFQKIRALREWVYARTDLAGKQEQLLDWPALRKLSLERTFSEFSKNEGGVWCSDVAIILARLYAAAGFDAWIFDYGDPNSLTHSTTFVAVDDAVYLQDAYFNFEYVDDLGNPLPVQNVLERLFNRDAPEISNPPRIKEGLFSTLAQPRYWTGAYEPECAPVQGDEYLCKIAVQLDSFVENHSHVLKSYDFLAQAGWPAKIDYLMFTPIQLVMFPKSNKGSPHFVRGDPHSDKILGLIDDLNERNAAISNSSLSPAVEAKEGLSASLRQKENKAFVQSIFQKIAGYRELPDIEKARALRQWVYENSDLASTVDSRIYDLIIDKPLSESFALFLANDGGVWCGGAAVLLSRVYEAAGFEAWNFGYGDEQTLSHVTTLVEIEGKLYVQDAYFNFEFLENGAPMPFEKVIQATAAGAPPPVASTLTAKDGHFLSAAEAKHWAGNYNPFCSEGEGKTICRAPIRYDRFVEIYFLIDEAYEFLSRKGWPRDAAYLMMEPVFIEEDGEPSKRLRIEALSKGDDSRPAQILSFVREIAEGAGVKNQNITIEGSN